MCCCELTTSHFIMYFFQAYLSGNAIRATFTLHWCHVGGKVSQINSNCTVGVQVPVQNEERKDQSSALLALKFVIGIHWWPEDIHLTTITRNELVNRSHEFSRISWYDHNKTKHNKIVYIYMLWVTLYFNKHIKCGCPGRMHKDAYAGCIFGGQPLLRPLKGNT